MTIRRIIIATMVASMLTFGGNSCAQSNATKVTGGGENVNGSISNFKELSIGNKMPLSVWKKIPKKKSVQLVILDFWSTGCTSCIEAFPEMAKLQQQFDEKLQVVLMDPWETAQQIQARMDRMNVNRIKNGMEPYTTLKTLPSISGDTVYKQLFPAHSVPHHVWLNAAGIVLYITYGYNADPVNVQGVLNGKKLNMAIKNDVVGRNLLEKGYIQPTEANMPPVYYSAFIPYFSAGASAGNRVDSIKATFRITRCNNSVIELFGTAFRDKDSEKRERMLLEMKNKEQYQRPDYHTQGHLLDDWNRRYSFTYEIQGPLKNKNNWQEKMRHDVNDFFGSLFGIEGVMETKSFNCLLLVKTKDGLLKTSGAEKGSTYRTNVSSWTNQPFGNIVSDLYQLEDMSSVNAQGDIGRPFLDESGVDPDLKVDMQLSGDLKDLENVRKQLEQYGLDIIQGKRDVKVLVIRDRN